MFQHGSFGSLIVFVFIDISHIDLVPLIDSINNHNIQNDIELFPKLLTPIGIRIGAI